MSVELRHDAETGETVEVPYTPASPAVPEVVTMRQAQLALLAAELLDDAEALIAGADRALQIEWATAKDVHRDSPWVSQIGAALNLDADAIDALFIDAAGR